MNTALHNMTTLPWEMIFEKVMRTCVVYLFLIVILRIAGKRELGQFNRFDLVVLLTLSNTLQNAIIGNDNSLVGGLIGGAVLIGANYLANRVVYRHRRIQALVEGHPTKLIEGGELLQRNLDKERLSISELESVVRKEGLERIDQVACAYLETSGMISIREKQPTPDQALLLDVVERTKRIETALQDLLGRAAPSPA